MLPSGNRLRQPAEFAAAIREGTRAKAGRLIIHLTSPAQQTHSGPRVGLVVPKAVGNAVARNRVKRRLRALAAARLGTLGAGELLVLRALPGCAELSSTELGNLLDTALRRARRDAERQVVRA